MLRKISVAGALVFAAFQLGGCVADLAVMGVQTVGLAAKTDGFNVCKMNPDKCRCEQQGYKWDFTPERRYFCNKEVQK